MSNADSPVVWKVIRGLNGTPDTNLLYEVMSHDGRTITNIKSKANIFINHYATVSKLDITKKNCNLNRLLEKRVNTPSVDNESCTSIKMSELLSAIQKMKRKGASGPDNIPPTFLKSLGSLALQKLLSIFNASFHLADYPWVWRVAVIIPLLKATKSPNDLASFLPISLTSCVIKLLEHIIADQHYYIAESSTTSVPFQLVFTKVEAVRNKYFKLSKL